MMRGASHVGGRGARRPTATSRSTSTRCPAGRERYRKIPVRARRHGARPSRSALGCKALTWSANRRSPRRSRSPRRRWAGRSASRSIVLHRASSSCCPRSRPTASVDVLGFHGFVPRRRGRRCGSAIFLGYLLADRAACKDIKRVFQYHGAEHKAIAAYENDVELTPESAQQFTTAHVRCGTNFLLTVMVVAIVVYSFVGRPGLPFAHRVRGSC